MGNKYQPSDARGTRSPPATPHCLKNKKWPTWSGKGSNSRFLGVPNNFCKISFSDSNTPCMRNINAGAEKGHKATHTAAVHVWKWG